MNPNNQIIEFFENNGIIVFDENMVIENIEIIENPENNHINEPVVLNLGPLPVLQRHNPPVYFGADAEELIADAPFQEFQCSNDFVMPVPCSRCYWLCCNETCEVEDTPFIQAIRAEQLLFEEEMDLPPPPRLTRNINTPLLDEEWKDMELLPSIPPPLTRSYTNAHLFDDEELLVALAEAESNMRDEYEAEFFEQQQQEQDADESDEFDMPEGVQYVCLTINEDKNEDEDEDKEQDR